MAFAPLVAGPRYNWQPRAPLVAALLICVPVAVMLGAVAYRKANEKAGVTSEELPVA